ncbi:rhamnogalacturonan acetylesterase [Phocaeicola sartorii]|uniref:rhamnogalacturonan acetylesterase n=1 Tax=Phocaeicola sartorii TaxID=671267 RepID=UPI00266EF8AA|nr:rhamnogalacturonan acetylesterase [Phocaeicola sartorii]
MREINMNITQILFIVLICFTPAAYGQVWIFDMTKPQPEYNDKTGYGYDRNTVAISRKQRQPMFFSVKVPEGDYKVTVTIGSKQYAGITALRAETRRMVVERMDTRKGELREVTFNVNVRTSYIDGQDTVFLHRREVVDWGWDNKLTLEFNGDYPAVSRIRIERNHPKMKIWLCGNSTVTDQDNEPYTSWGQILPYWFDENVAVENMAMSGLRTISFIEQNRLAKIVQEVKYGDYVLIEFGHNDEKDNLPGCGAWYNFTYNLKRFIDCLRPKGVRIILVTPMERRHFENGKIRSTHGDYPEAIRTIAKRESLPLIDLTMATTRLYNVMGESLSKKLFVHYPANTYPRQDRELKDNTHTNAFGAYEVSKLIVMEMKNNGIELVQYLRTAWQDFIPYHYDNYQQFYWPKTPINYPEEPEGN